MSRQLLIENKLLVTFLDDIHPYFSIGLGEGFNHAYAFQVTPQNPEEIATATFESYDNKTFIYTFGLGLDFDVEENIRIGAGYHLAYLGKYDLGKGRLETGIDGSVESLPSLKSNHSSFNQEVLIQLTYLF